jgi:hypothetical protein
MQSHQEYRTGPIQHIGPIAQFGQRWGIPTITLVNFGIHGIHRRTTGEVALTGVPTHILTPKPALGIVIAIGGTAIDANHGHETVSIGHEARWLPGRFRRWSIRHGWWCGTRRKGGIGYARDAQLRRFQIVAIPIYNGIQNFRGIEELIDKGSNRCTDGDIFGRPARGRGTLDKGIEEWTHRGPSFGTHRPWIGQVCLASHDFDLKTIPTTT